MCSVIENAPEGLVAVLGGEGSGRGGAEGRKGEGKLDHGGDGGTQPKSAVSDEELARRRRQRRQRLCRLAKQKNIANVVAPRHSHLSARSCGEKNALSVGRVVLDHAVKTTPRGRHPVSFSRPKVNLPQAGLAPLQRAAADLGVA